MTPGDLCARSATWIAASIRDGSLTCVEVARAHLDRIERLDDRLRAFTFVDPPAVLVEAERLDRVLAESGPLGVLHGVPVAVKDLIFTRDQPTRGGSPAYADFTPPADDVAVERVRAAGGLILGKTNVPVFGFGPGTANTLTGVTRHPFDPDRSPGGSSGGSAVAVATGMAPLALGSDGGGSIRIPAALCGVLGMKPTFGLVPLHPSCRDSAYPGFSAWETLEHIGPMARNADDLALLLSTLVGLDTRDRHSVPSPFGELSADPSLVAGLRVAVAYRVGPSTPRSVAARTAVETAVAAIVAAGAEVEEIEVDLPEMTAAFNALAALEADLPGLRRLREAHPDALNPRIERMVDADWTFEHAADAARVRQDVSNALATVLRRFDLLLTPCLPSTSVPLEATGAGPSDPQALSGYTMPLNFSGHPALSVPVSVPGEPEPVGVQLVADRFRDDVILGAAGVLPAVPDRSGRLS
jgi:aspartyl-tRNA(Asn)/glutamyl-tRNA(Gln) amidotransferase subunit A